MPKKLNGINLVKLILSFLLIFSLFKIGSHFYESYDNEKMYASINKSKENNLRTLTPKFEQLLNQNPDFNGWIQVPDTRIDYPVVKSSDNEFYLNHNFEKEQSKHGAIFMDYRNQGYGLDRHTIVYGHYMKDGSMFKDLEKYSEQQFYENNPIIYTHTNNGKKIKWKVFSTYVTDTNFYYIETDFASDDVFKDFIDNITDKSLIASELDVTTDNQILTLSTCSYEFDDARFVVHATRIN